MATMKWTSLKNNPDLKGEINIIIERLKTVNSEDDLKHLADIGCILRSISTDLKELSEETFNRHNEQKFT